MVDDIKVILWVGKVRPRCDAIKPVMRSLPRDACIGSFPSVHVRLFSRVSPFDLPSPCPSFSRPTVRVSAVKTAEQVADGASY